MRLAIITPTKHLDLTTLYGNKYHMVLAHRFKSDPIYKEFYKLQKKNGSVVVLDNGACELKSSIKGKDLYEISSDLHPDYLVVPDVLDQFEETIDRSTQFMSKFQCLRDQGTKFIAVVQGKTPQDWTECFRKWFEDKRVDTIGISSIKGLSDFDPSLKDRFDVLKKFIKEGIYDGSKEVHILGLGDSGHFELRKLAGLDFIEGVDSSAPVVHGYNGLKIIDDKEYKKIREYIPDNGEINEDQLRLVKANIRLFLKSAKSDARKGN